MEEQDDALDAFGAACDRDLGDPDLWYDPDGYPESLALCIIDSIYSTGAHYSSVVNVVRRYRDDRAARGGNADTDGSDELLANFDDHGGVDAWAIAIGNRRPTSTKSGAPLKAEAIRDIARKLSSMGISTANSLRAKASKGSLAEAKSEWTATPGQRSGITWEYALMLAKIPGVKADRMVVRYVTRALDRTVTPSEAAELIQRLAARRGWDVIQTDHAIWRFESGRQVNRDGDPVEPDADIDPPSIAPPLVGLELSSPERGLAMIVIDAVTSPGTRYDAVVAILNRYRQLSVERGRSGDADGITELLLSFEELGGPEEWASAIGNRRRRRSGDTEFLVAEVILSVAERLDEAGVRRVVDLRNATDAGRLSEIEAAWRSVPSQSSGLSWGYALLLAGLE